MNPVTTHFYALSKLTDFLHQVSSLAQRFRDYTENLHDDYTSKCTLLEENNQLVESAQEEKRRNLEKRVEQLREENATLRGKLDQRESKVKMENSNHEKSETQHETIIKLDVGGDKFTTSLTTLCKDHNSMMAAMFSGRHKSSRCEDGSYFIDRDGTHFIYILNYLRGSVLSPGDLPDDVRILAALRRETDFYQIQGLIELIDECLETPSVKLDFSQEEITRMLSTLDEAGEHLVNESESNGDQSNGSSNIAAQHHISMTKCKLDFTNKFLNGITFAHTTFLHDVSFRNARLVGASFYGCEFGSGVKINFNYADLTDCDFRQCKGKENGSKRTFAHGGGLLSVSSSETFLRMVQERKVTFKMAKIENALFDSKVSEFLTSNLDR